MIGIRECPQWLDRAADYFSARWNIGRQLYLDSMHDSLAAEKRIPRWYLMLRDDAIVGGFGLIENDFMVRSDLRPWLCGLYVEPNERGKRLGARLLAHGRKEAARLGFDRIYLNTDHVGYYEKYGWRYMGGFAHRSGVDARVYEAGAIEGPEEMSAFFDARADTYDSHMLDDLKLDAFYEAIAACFDGPMESLLDLGCGTGLELERLFERYPDMEVTGVDMSAGMLKKLEGKFPGKNLRLICGSYFDADFGGPFDHVLSTYSLHHFSEERKLALYKRLLAVLGHKGRFVFGDYTVPTQERRYGPAAENGVSRQADDLAHAKLYHFDMPFTAETEMRLMRAAGFASAEVVRQWENTSILIAGK